MTKAHYSKAQYNRFYNIYRMAKESRLSVQGYRDDKDSLIVIC